MPLKRAYPNNLKLNGARIEPTIAFVGAVQYLQESIDCHAFPSPAVALYTRVNLWTEIQTSLAPHHELVSSKLCENSRTDCSCGPKVVGSQAPASGHRHRHVKPRNEIANDRRWKYAYDRQLTQISGRSKYRGGRWVLKVDQIEMGNCRKHMTSPYDLV